MLIICLIIYSIFIVNIKLIFNIKNNSLITIQFIPKNLIYNTELPDSIELRSIYLSKNYLINEIETESIQDSARLYLIDLLN